MTIQFVGGCLGYGSIQALTSGLEKLAFGQPYESFSLPLEFLLGSTEGGSQVVDVTNFTRFGIPASLHPPSIVAIALGGNAVRVGCCVYI